MGDDEEPHVWDGTETMGGAGRVVASTRERDEAAAMLRRTFPDMQLDVAGGASPFLFRHSAVRGSGLTSTELVLSGRAVATGTLPDESVAAGFKVAGHCRIDYARHTIDTGRPYLRPSARSVTQLQDAHLRLILFDRDAFRHAAGRYAEEGSRVRLGAGRTAPVSDDAGRAWLWAAQRIHDTARDPRAFANTIVTGELFDLGVRMMLACFGERTEPSTAPEATASPASVRRAIAYLEEHADDAVAIPDVAAAARVSVRSLQSLFRRHLGVSPLEHLHALRLEAARRELQATDGEVVRTVHDVALRWGFANGGRFARQYAARFGERPSDTLHRGA